MTYPAKKMKLGHASREASCEAEVRGWVLRLPKGRWECLRPPGAGQTLPQGLQREPALLAP